MNITRLPRSVRYLLYGMAGLTIFALAMAAATVQVRAQGGNTGSATEDAARDTLELWRQVFPHVRRGIDRARQGTEPRGWAYNQQCRPGRGACAGARMCHAIAVPNRFWRVETFVLEQSALGVVIEGLRVRDRSSAAQRRLAALAEAVGVSPQSPTDAYIQAILQRLSLPATVRDQCEAFNIPPENMRLAILSAAAYFDGNGNADEQAAAARLETLLTWE